MALLDEVSGYPAWAVIRLRDADCLTVLGGTRRDVERIADIPLETTQPPDGRRIDRLALLPFAQVRERGFEAHDDGTPLSVLTVEHQREVPLREALGDLPTEPPTVTDPGGFETDDDSYAKVVEAILRDEIGRGEGANLVIGRRWTARLGDWGHTAALSVLRRLLERERGAYWTFCVFTGDRYLIGASPERHVSIESGSVRMNPISGTFRLKGLTTHAERKAALLDFLADEKEIYELFMVVDEELKMMCDICSEGGLVLGPYLKPMTHLMHTEYLLAGATSKDPREVLRDSMFAATVTGSPVQNACRLIKEYEGRGRGYYASVLALFGREPDGTPMLDAPILIRTADVDLDGGLSVTAGATLVRDSDPAYETAETHAKAAGVLTAFGLVPEPPASDGTVSDLASDEDVLIALGRRNSRLSPFWLTDQSGQRPVPELAGRTAVILDGEDAFVNMLRHVLGVLGMTSSVVRHEDWTPQSLSGHDLVVVGPGPGDPRERDHPKIAAFRAAVGELLATEQPFLAVCLGHQVLSDALGLDLAYKDIVFQGTQTRLDVLGAEEVVGFYNTFVSREPAQGLPAGVRVEVEPQSGDVHLLAGPTYRGVQFHAESILTQHGHDLLRRLVLELIG